MFRVEFSRFLARKLQFARFHEKEVVIEDEMFEVSVLLEELTLPDLLPFLFEASRSLVVLLAM